MNYTIITENDVSQWNDMTGNFYHFPSRYLKLMEVGTKLIYYKGKLKDRVFENRRLSSEPHYFGIAIVEGVFIDPDSTKNDYFAKISNYLPFAIPVIAKVNNEFLETIPESRLKNYWRDGVRGINDKTYQLILSKSDLTDEFESSYNDLNQGLETSLESTLTDGKKKFKYTSYYERRPENRQQALLIHGYTCMACDFNYEKTYGELGKGYIHVHHLLPVSESGETKIDPKNDLIVLCANCHAMVHRQKNKTLSINKLKECISQNLKK